MGRVTPVDQDRYAVAKPAQLPTESERTGRAKETTPPASAGHLHAVTVTVTLH
jgi:hypothetical protein